MYLGLLIGLILPLTFQYILTLEVDFIFFILIISIVPMALDGFTQLIGLRESNNKARFITGALAGVMLGVAFCWLIYNSVCSFSIS